MCGYISESGLHMLRDCSKVTRTWSGLVRHGGTKDFFDKFLNLIDWVIRNISSKNVMGNVLSGVLYLALIVGIFGRNDVDLFSKRKKYAQK